MKIKTALNQAKNTLVPPPLTSAQTQAAGTTRRSRGCCSTWTCCDCVLLFFIIAGVIVVVSGVAAVWMLTHFVEHNPERWHASTVHATCRVAEIIDEGKVCCGSKSNTCKAGIAGDLNAGDWYKFTDEAMTSSENNFEEWEKVEEWERREFEEHGEEWKKEWIDEDERNDQRREKRSWNKLQRNFTCYKIVLQGRKNDNGGEDFWDFLLGSHSSEEDSSSEEHLQWRHGDDYHGGRHHGGHNSDERDDRDGAHENDDNDEHFELRETRQTHPERQPSSVKDAEDRLGSRKEKGDQENVKFKPEAGIVALEDSEPVDDIYTAMFYDGLHTIKHFSQCSYSACGGRRCQSTVDIEERMRKWWTRLRSKTEFGCTVQDERELRFIHHLRHAAVPLSAAILVLLLVLIIRRIRASKRRQGECRSATAVPTPAKYACPVATPGLEPATLSKKEEANLPTSAPPVVLSTTMPSYEEMNARPQV